MDISAYEKPLKKLMALLGLLILSPLVLSVAFKALRAYNTSPGIYIAYLLLFIGASLVLFTVYFGFKTFKSFLDVLFNE
ncbi:DUF6095 family protein [Tenacibaculum geojense]|uniref:DUF6095 family protein n=1 Tax=Tenacibaculum geojense TaxID=915352 RepID=A0ABW3JU22_9FLAO